MENLFEKLAAARENLRKVSAAIIAAPATTPREEAMMLYVARWAADEEVYCVGKKIANAINAGEIPAGEVYEKETAERIGRVIAQLEPGQFWPLPGASYGPFLDGSYYSIGVVAGEGGLKIIEGACFNALNHFGLTYIYVGDWHNAKCHNGKVTVT